MLACCVPWLQQCRGINGVGSATSPESAADLVVGRPGTPGTPTALSGQTGFVVSFSPGKNSIGSAGLVQQMQQNAKESASNAQKKLPSWAPWFVRNQCANGREPAIPCRLSLCGHRLLLHHLPSRV